MYTKTDRTFLYYKFNNIYFKVPTFGYIFKIIDSEKSTTSNFKSRVNALRQLIDESKVSFDRRGNVKFAPQSDLASRLTIQSIINSSPQGKDLIKKIARMDPLLFDVPEGGTLFSKILGRAKGIKIENKMGIVRESLDDAFTNIGKKTKPLRNFFLEEKSFIFFFFLKI